MVNQINNKLSFGSPNKNIVAGTALDAYHPKGLWAGGVVFCVVRLVSSELFCTIVE